MFSSYFGGKSKSESSKNKKSIAQYCKQHKVRMATLMNVAKNLNITGWKNMNTKDELCEAIANEVTDIDDFEQVLELYSTGYSTGEKVVMIQNYCKEHNIVVKTLKASAKYLQIKGYSTMNKEDLCTAIAKESKNLADFVDIINTYKD